MKRFLALLLAIVLAASLVPVPVQAETGGKLVAMTFDDGVSSKYTEQLLDGLKERGVSATFFILGQNAQSNISIVERAYEEGHEIACHTWDHPNLKNCSETEVERQIEDTLELLDVACGDEADYLVRPPYGATTKKVRDNIDVPLIFWSVDSRDWSLLDVEKVREKIVAETFDGCIILCHDIHETTITAALGAIDDLMEQGYEFVTVSELFRRRGRELELHKLHYSSAENGVDYGPIPAPQITASGDADGVNTVTISCTDENVPLYYTLDGSYPNQEAECYTGPFTVPYGTPVTAVAAYKLNGSRSLLTEMTADDILIVAPDIMLDDSGLVVMTTPTIESDIYFTANDTEPGTDSVLYAVPEPIVGPCHLRAVTVHEKGVSAQSWAFLSGNGDLYYDMDDGQWFYEAMDWAHRSGILNGTAPYTMSPAGIASRAMLVTMLYRFSGDTLESGWTRTNTFMDVDESSYYAEAVEWAYRNHIVDGYGPNDFGPDDVVTRQQMCKIVASFLRWMEKPLRPGESGKAMFADEDQLASWALEPVRDMAAAGLIQGDNGNFNPNAGANRAQFCTVLMRLVEYIDNYRNHVHQWQLNRAKEGSNTEGDISIGEGDLFRLRIECRGDGCSEIAQYQWTASSEGVVCVNGTWIAGIMAGGSTWLTTEWEGVTYKCMIRVHKQPNDVPEIYLPA